VNDKDTLDEIAKGLSEEKEWGASTLEWIADLVVATGRGVTYDNDEVED
jgi:hypothetical protein